MSFSFIVFGMPTLLRLFVFTLVMASSNTLANSYRVVMELSPPHQTIVNNEIVGEIPSQLTSYFNAIGEDVIFEMYPWNRALEIAKAEANTFISNIARTPEREDLFEWVAIVHRYRLGLVSLEHRDDLLVEKLEDAKQYTIAVQRGDFAFTYLLQKGFSENTNLFLTADITESWRLLQRGKVDFVIDDIENLPEMNLKVLKNDQSAKLFFHLEDLSIDTWLAANKTVDASTLKKLREVSRTY